MARSRAVVLDGSTLTQADLNWSELAELVDVDIAPPGSSLDWLRNPSACEILLVNKVRLGHEELASVNGLRYVGILATGSNIVDLEAAKDLGIVVTNVPGYGTDSVAQHTFLLMLDLAANLHGHVEAARDGRWTRSGEFCVVVSPLHELAGKTLLVVGFGQIGRAVARIALAFGMKVLASDPSLEPGEECEGVRGVELREGFRTADVVSLHCPLTEENEHMVNAKLLASMKPGAWLVNTARGALVDENALLEALRHGPLEGAALDVLEVEPPLPTHPLLNLRNCRVTPHIAWATREARARLMHEAIENVRAFLRGEARNALT